jgi:hypothetical protein
MSSRVATWISGSDPPIMQRLLSVLFGVAELVSRCGVSPYPRPRANDLVVQLKLLQLGYREVDVCTN